jgi:hypothetical protein
MAFVSEDDADIINIKNNGYPHVTRLWLKYYNLIDFVSNTMNTVFDL